MMCLAFEILGVEGENAHRNRDPINVFPKKGMDKHELNLCAAPQIHQGHQQEEFLSQVAYFYETCRNVLFQTSTPLPNLVEMAGELKNYEGTQTSADRLIT